MAQPLRIDPDAGIPDLIHRLGDDAKRLVTDEMRLAKLETTDSLHRAGRGAMWLGAAFGIGIVALVSLTLFGATLIGRIANGHMWIGAIVMAVADIAVGFVLLKRGVRVMKEPSYTLAETRAALTGSPTS